MALFSTLGNEETSEESFEQLFEKMQVMKREMSFFFFSSSFFTQSKGS